MLYRGIEFLKLTGSRLGSPKQGLMIRIHWGLYGVPYFGKVPPWLLVAMSFVSSHGVSGPFQKSTPALGREGRSASEGPQQPPPERVMYWGYIGIMENQMEKKMENEMETGIIVGYRVYIGVYIGILSPNNGESNGKENGK